MEFGIRELEIRKRDGRSADRATVARGPIRTPDPGRRTPVAGSRYNLEPSEPRNPETPEPRNPAPDRVARLAPMLLVLLLTAGGALAQRINHLSADVDSVAAVDDNPQVGGLRFDRLVDDYTFTWGLYPTLRLDSRGESSQLDLFYSFGLNRVDTDLDFDSESHAAGLDWAVTRPRYSMRLSNQYRRSPDFATFNFFRGITFTPEGIFFDYETLALRRTSHNNNADWGLDYRIGARSLMTFGLGHSLRQYEQDPLFARRITDQRRYSGDMGFRRELSARSSLDTRYRFSYFDYETGIYHDARNHDMTLGFNRQVTPTVSLRLGAGPSYTDQAGTDFSFWGYNAEASISKRFEREFISLYYRRANAASIGIGSVSKTQRLGFGFTRHFTRRFSGNFGLSLFETERLFDNRFDLRGLQSSLVFSFLLSRNLFLNVGAGYQSQREIADLEELDLFGRFGLDRRRAFVSLRFALPQFWRF